MWVDEGEDFWHEPPSGFAVLPLWQRLGIFAAVALVGGVMVFAINDVGGSELFWLLFWLSVFVGWLALIVATAIGLFRLGKRKRTRGWWTLIIGLFLFMLLIPLLGVITAAVVVLAERRTKPVSTPHEPQPPEASESEGSFTSPILSAPAIPATADPIRSSAGLARALQVLFAFLIGVSALSIAARWVEYLIIDDPAAITFGDIQSSSDRIRMLSIGMLVLTITVAVVFISWTHRLYRNLPGLGWEPRFESGWAIGGWFVPILSLWRPKQVIDDIWRGSAAPPEVPREGASVPWLLHAWWTAFILAGLAQTSAASRSDATADELRTRVVELMGAQAVVIVAAILAFWVVTLVTRRQICAAERRTAQVVPPRGWSDNPKEPRGAHWAKAASLPALAIVLAVSATVLWVANLSEVAPASGTGDAVTTDDLRIGDCIDVPDEGKQFLSVAVKPCDDPHDAEIVDIVDAPVSMAFPGQERAQTGLDLCKPSIETYMGVPLIESALGIYVMSPSEMGWERGDRRFTCAFIRPDREPISGSVRGAGRLLPSGEVSILALRESECFDDAATFDSFIVELRQCSTSHDNEVLAVIEHPSPLADYPGDDAMIDFAVAGCSEAFANRVDPNLRELLDFEGISGPVDATWEDGHHTVVCAVWDRNLGKLDRSVVTLGQSGSTTSD